MNLLVATGAQCDQVPRFVSASLQSSDEAVGMRAHLAIATKLAGLAAHPRVELAIATSLASLSGLKKDLVMVYAVALRFVKFKATFYGAKAFGSAITELYPALCTAQSAVSPVAGQPTAINTPVVLSNGSRFAKCLGAILASLRAAVTELAAIGAGFGQAISHGITSFTKEYTMPIAKGLSLRLEL